MAEKGDLPMEPEMEDQATIIGMLTHALDRAVNASAEVAALKAVLIANGIKIDPDEYARALADAKEHESAKANGLTRDVRESIRDFLRSG